VLSVMLGVVLVATAPIAVPFAREMRRGRLGLAAAQRTQRVAKRI